LHPADALLSGIHVTVASHIVPAQRGIRASRPALTSNYSGASRLSRSGAANREHGRAHHDIGDDTLVARRGIDPAVTKVGPRSSCARVEVAPVVEHPDQGLFGPGSVT